MTTSEARGAMIRLTDKLNLLAHARISMVMGRRRAEGRSVIDAAKARCVLFALVNRSDQDGCCHPSLSLLAAESDVPARTLQAVLSVLQDEGLVRVQHRHQRGGADRTNLYQIVWDALAECAEGGQRSCATESPHLFDRGRVDCALMGATVAPMRAQKPRPQGRTDGALRAQPLHQEGAVPAPEGRSGACRSKEEPPNEPPNEPAPNPPEGGKPEGGGGDALARQTEIRIDPADRCPTQLAPGDTDRAWAERVRGAYPCHRTDSPLPIADEDAVVEAMAAERLRASGVRPEEILRAARQVADDAASGRLRSVLRLRVWARGRGYVAHAEAQRALRAAAESRPGPIDTEAAAKAMADREAAARAERHAAEADRERLRRERDAEIEAELAGLSVEELEGLRARIAAAETTAFGRQHWSRKSVRADPALRQRMAELHRADRAGQLVPEGAAA